MRASPVVAAVSIADEVKARVDIVDLIAEQVALQRSGRTFKARCPFHQEKTPSFIVDPDRQTWRCFGQCSEGGDAFSWVMKHEAVDFREALQRLAQRAGVPLSAPDSRRREREDQRQQLLRANDAALRFWADQLAAPSAGEDARAYLSARGLTQDAIQRFSLGYAGSDQDSLVHHLTARGYRSEILEAAGLILITEHGPRDRFRDRLMFPIRNPRGEVVGFGGRTLIDEPAKYINTPESDLFKKRSLLYGLDLARQHIRELGSVIVVEGYTDVISAHMHGSPNAVASMGTALTDAQVQLLKPLTNDLRFALDADAAGQAATRRGIETVSHQDQMDADIRVIELPLDRDPDDLIRSEPDRWQSLVEDAPPYVDWLIDRARSEHDLETPRGRSDFARELVPIVQAISDEILRDTYLRRVAAYARLDAAQLLARRAFPAPRRRAPSPEPEIEIAETSPREAPIRSRDNQQSFILTLALTHQSAAQELDESALNLIDDQQDREILAALIAVSNMGGAEWPSNLTNDEQARCEELRRSAQRLPPFTDGEAAEAIGEALRRIRIRRTREGLRLSGQQLGELERDLDRAQIALVADAFDRGAEDSVEASPELAAAAEVNRRTRDEALSLHRRTPTSDRPSSAAS